MYDTDHPLEELCNLIRHSKIPKVQMRLVITPKGKTVYVEQEVAGKIKNLTITHHFLPNDSLEHVARATMESLAGETLKVEY